MVNEDLNKFISAERNLGTKDADIKSKLLGAGWPQNLVDEGFASPEVPSYSASNQIYSIKEHFRASWLLTKTKFWSTLGILAVPTLLYLAIVMIGGIVFGITSVAAGTTSPLFIALIGIFGLIFFISVIIIQFWGIAATMINLASQEKIGVRGSFSRSWQYVKSLWFVMIIGGLLMYGNSILLFVPGLIFGLWIMFAAYMVLFEGQKGISALIRSRDTVKGHLWNIMVKYLCLFLLAIPVWLVSVIFESIDGLQIISMIINFAYNIFFAVFSVAFSYTLYKNISEVKNLPKEQYTTSRKFKFALSGIIGLVLGIVIIIWLATYLPSLNKARMIEPPSTELYFPSNQR